MSIILNYKKKKIQQFAKAIRNNDNKTIKRLCHKQCQFIGFREQPGTLDSVLKANLNKENTTVKNAFWTDGKILYKTSITQHEVMTVLGIEAEMKLTVKFDFKFKKIKTIEVTEWLRKMATEDIQKWEAYTEYTKETIHSKDFDILSDIVIAKKYIQDKP